MSEVHYDYDVVLTEVEITTAGGVVTKFVGDRAQRMIQFLQEQGLPASGTVKVGGARRPKTKVKRTFSISLDNDAFLQSLEGRTRSKVVDRAITLYRASLPQSDPQAVFETLVSEAEEAGEGENTPAVGIEAIDFPVNAAVEGKLLKF